jgi:hypothetical protein
VSALENQPTLVAHPYAGVLARKLLAMPAAKPQAREDTQGIITTTGTAPTREEEA